MRARILPAILLAVVVAVTGYTAFRTIDPLFACEIDIRASIPAPDGKTSIVVFENACGATVGFNTQVSVAPVGGTFSPASSPPFLVLSGRQDLVVQWLDGRVIEVRIPSKEDVLKREAVVAGITVTYRYPP